MGTLLETIAAVAAKARKFGDRHLGEQNTKASLIEPVLEALGWDIRDPDEVHREFRPTGKDSPVDYALKLMRKPRLFLEAKGLGEGLGDRRWIAQVLGYAVVAGVEWCVLTDGNEYRFYNATAPIDAEEKMFYRVRLTEGNAEDAERALSLMSRDNLEQNLMDVLWVSHFVDRRVKGALRDALAGPSRAMIRLIHQQVPKLSPREIADSVRRLEIRIESPAASLPAAGRGRVAKASRGVQSSRTPRSTPAAATGSAVSLSDLIRAGLLKTPLRLFRRTKGVDFEATVRADGGVEFQGQVYPSSSAAAEAARSGLAGRKMNTNGWTFWKFTRPDGKPALLDTLRQRLRGTPAAPREGARELRLADERSERRLA